MPNGDNQRHECGRRGHKRRPARVIIWLLLVGCLGTAAVLGYLGLSELMERRAGDDYYADLAAFMAAPDAGSSGGASPAGGTAASGDTAPAGGTAASGDTAPAGGTVASGDTAPAGGTTGSAASGDATPAGGAAAVGNEATGGDTAPAGGTASTGNAAAGDTATAGGTMGSASTGDAASADGAAGVKLNGGVRPSAVNFDALRKSCPDAVCWISIEGTCINYPVVQGDDNLYYLKHLPDRTENSAGSILMDAACDPLFGNDVTILHGHHMRSGAMFGDLDDYREAAYYEAHPVIRLYTPDGDWDVDVFAACTVNGATFGYPTVFSGEQAFDQFVKKLTAASAFDAGVEVSYGDRVLLLSTCAYTFEDARFVVAGRIRQQ